MAQDNNIVDDVISPAPLQLDITGLQRGIDNYHIDVKLSNRFTANINRLIITLLQEETTGREKLGGRNWEKLLTPVRESYLDMMTVLIHRIKTNLTEKEIHFLQFAIPYYILQKVRTGLNEQINQAKFRAAELRSYGSGDALKVHHHVAWLSRNYNAILYRINRQIFEQLYRVETRELRHIRSQYLNSMDIEFTEFMFNPLLLNRDLNAALFLIEHYVYWGANHDESDFPALNQSMESLLCRLFPELDTRSLKETEADPPVPTEIYDALGGLHAIRPYMGPAVNTKHTMTEEFCWLDFPPNIDHLFNLSKFIETAREVRRESGKKAWREYRKEVKRVENALEEVAGMLKKRGLLRRLVASYEARRLWSVRISREVDSRLLCQFLGGQVSLERLQDPAMGGKPLNDEEIKAAREGLKQADKEARSRALENSAKILYDLARFRKHLKYFRFAHRVFNRMNVLTEKEDIQLSRQARTLYQLPMADEIEEDEEKVVHHVILKADVRGSTTVTDKLEKMGLNPASYFSMHFFNPINALLGVFGAGKVFIEGDAIILSFLEHEHSPQQWYGVARACGLARAMLNIIHANNKHARQTGLPLLELGIGICYSDEAPRFLFDGDRPIMISSAIGLADRMSSCSWLLRDRVDPGVFNVEVLAIPPSEENHRDKGQDYMRYNVNGILLDNSAFAKLRSEVSLRRVNVRIDGRPAVLYSGEYPDVQGRKRALVIREGRTGQWRAGTVMPADGDSPPFYEVVTNGKVISQFQNRVDSKETEATQ